MTPVDPLYWLIEDTPQEDKQVMYELADDYEDDDDDEHGDCRRRIRLTSPPSPL